MSLRPSPRSHTVSSIFWMLALIGLGAAMPASGIDDHLLICEVAQQPTSGEFIEIYNPTGTAVDLTNYYLSDDEDYAVLPGASGAGPAPSISSSDFIAQFPPGSSIAANGVIVIAFDGAGFIMDYGVAADFEIAGTDAGTPDMLATDVGASAGITNSGENVSLFFWDGASDLVMDVDAVNVGVPSSSNDLGDKTGLTVDGPDGDTTASMYATDAFTIPLQAAAHVFGESTKRMFLEGGFEMTGGGNGITGDDETTEDISLTWDSTYTAPNPGTCNAMPLTQTLILNEVQADPDSANGDANGDGTSSTTQDEFVEIYNDSGFPLDISGWTLADAAQVRHTFPMGTVIPDQCAVVVFGGGAPMGSFGNALVQTASTGGLGLNNTGDSVILNDGMGDVLTAMYGSEGGNNQSVTLDPDITGTLPYVEHSTATGSGGALFSPGTLIDGTSFAGCPTAPPADWIINEIHADPDATNGDANGDGTVSTTDDEFVEIFNDSGAPMDISGWTLSDAVGVKHTFPGGTVVPDQCAVVVFGGGTPTGTFEDAIVQTATTGGLGLTNGGDSVILNDGVGDVVTAMFGGEGGNNESINLDPDLTGMPPYVLHSTVTGAGGSIYSPGTLVDGTGFSGCLAAASGWIINEVNADPDTVNGDANGDGVVNTGEDEFVELVNATGGASDISGWTVSDGVGVRHTFPPGTVVPDLCSIVVFAGGTPTGGFGGSQTQTASTGQLGFNNSGDTVILNDGVSDIASLSYGSEGGNNTSLTLSPDINGTPPLIQHNTAPGSGGALFSPGTQVDGGAFVGCPPPPSGIIINEIQADPDTVNGDANGDGTADFGQDEFVEIFNNSGGDLDMSNWTLSDAAQVRHTFPMGTVIPNQCGIVVFGGGTPTGEFGNVMVQTASTGSLGLNNGGDTVTLNDTMTDLESVTYGAEGGDNQSITLDPDLTGTPPYVKHSVAMGSGGTLFSPGTKVDGVTFFGCPVGNREIFEIQGNGDASPFDGQVVTTLGNIVTAVGTDRFFMQTPDGRSDGDASTSDGIVVFTGSAPTVAVGDEVDVVGEVDEFFGLTEFTNNPVVVVNSSVNPLPAIVDFNASTPSTVPMTPHDLERFEGMRVRMMNGTISAPTDNFGDTFVVANITRLFREPGIIFPGLPGLPVWDGNPEAFEIDPDGLGGMDASYFANLPIAAEGVLTFSFGDYQILPTTPPIVISALDDLLPPLLPRPVRARNFGEMTLGTQNMLRLFDDVNDGIGEPVPSAMEYQQQLEKLSLQIRDVLRSPDVVAAQEVENLNALGDLAAQIALDDPTVVYTAVLMEGNDVGGIDVGFLVRDTVQILNVEQIGADEIFPFDGSLLNDRPPLVLEASYMPPIIGPEGGGGGYELTFVVVHQRSLSGIDDASSGPRVRMKRQAQAEFLSAWIGGRQMVDPQENLIIAGDFNAYEFTDGYAHVLGQVIGDPADASQAQIPGTDDVNPNLTDQINTLAPNERYSFVFGESAQVLDHFLTSVPANASVVEMQFGRSNADVSDDFGDMPMTALRSSDHDGAVLFLSPVIPLPPLGLTIDGGICPGLLTFTLSNAQPNSTVAVMGGRDTGSAVVDRGECAGTVLGLDRADIVRRVTTDGSGQASFQRFLTLSRCDQLFQLMELPPDRELVSTSNVGTEGISCRTGAVESVPVASAPTVFGGPLTGSGWLP